MRTKIDCVIDEFLNYLKQKGLSKHTVKSYYHTLKNLTFYLQENNLQYIEEVNKQVIREYVSYLLSDRQDDQRNICRSVSTKALMLQQIKMFFNRITRLGYFLKNPMDQVDIPKSKRGISRNFLTRKEIVKLFKIIDTTTLTGFMDRTLYELLYGTGLRIQEAHNLKVSDMDLEEKLVYVRLGKGGKDRTVPLPEVTQMYVKKYMEKVRTKIVKRTKSESDLLFLNGRGAGLNQIRTNRWLKFYTVRANIKKQITCHCLRYSYATHMLENGIDIRQLSELMGHASLDSTAKYTRVIIERLKEEVRKHHPKGILKKNDLEQAVYMGD